jgi:hypothetical protein
MRALQIYYSLLQHFKVQGEVHINILLGSQNSTPFKTPLPSQVNAAVLDVASSLRLTREELGVNAAARGLVCFSPLISLIFICRNNSFGVTSTRTKVFGDLTIRDLQTGEVSHIFPKRMREHMTLSLGNHVLGDAAAR